MFKLYDVVRITNILHNQEANINDIGFILKILKTGGEPTYEVLLLNGKKYLFKNYEIDLKKENTSYSIQVLDTKNYMWITHLTVDVLDNMIPEKILTEMYNLGVKGLKLRIIQTIGSNTKIIFKY